MPLEEKNEEILAVKPCTEVLLLSQLFLQLAEDEKSDVQRSEQRAIEEMADFLERGEKAYIFTVSEDVVGYALVNINRMPPYLHHFYICREHRRKAYGTCAFNRLLDTLGADGIDLDVYDWNERGKSFWASLGFKPRAVIMRYKK